MKARSCSASFARADAAVAFAVSGSPASGATVTTPASASAAWPGNDTVRECASSRMTASCVTRRASGPTKAEPPWL
jgi:hypothetical protein